MSETYTDLSHTRFPDQVDDSASHEYMSNVTSDVASLVNQYETQIRVNNFASAKSLLENNPELRRCIFTAEDYNWLRDAVIASQRFYSNDAQEMINYLTENVGVSADPSDKNITAYSASKVDSLISTLQSSVQTDINKMKQVTTKNYTLANGKWVAGSGNSTYYYPLPLNEVFGSLNATVNDDIDIMISNNATVAQGKAWSRAVVMTSTTGSTNQTLNLLGYGKKPTVDIPLTITVHKA